MVESTERPLLDEKRAASYMGLSESILAKWRVYGRGPRYVKLGRAVRYRPTDLDDYVESNLRRSTSEA